jgi:hypothetical protein
MKLKLFLFISIIFSFGCLKVLNINIINPNAKIVIDAVITDGAGPYFVSISRATNINSAAVYSTKDSAKIYIWDNFGQRDTLIKVKDGLYQTRNLRGVMGRTYYIEVRMENNIYSASNKMPYKVGFDKMDLDSLSINGLKIYTIIPRFTDPPTKGNYYRFVQKINDSIDNAYYLLNDDVNNGVVNKTPLIAVNAAIRIKKGDSVSMEMQCMNKEEFEYFSTLSQQTSFGINANSAPSNPKSNFNGNVLGFFSCHTSEYKSLGILK